MLSTILNVRPSNKEGRGLKPKSLIFYVENVKAAPEGTAFAAW